jgi:prepilin-type N-terminal cleavage/methylation domain-containing protein
MAGFTMMEILVVVTLIAILTAVAIPMFKSSSDRKAELEGAQIESIIRHAQVLARTRRESFQVAFSVAQNVVALFDVAGGQTALSGKEIPMEKLQAGDEDYVYYLPHGTLKTVDFAGTAFLTFGSGGAAQDGGQVVITYGDYDLTITVTQTTGSVSMQGVWK